MSTPQPWTAPATGISRTSAAAGALIGTVLIGVGLLVAKAWEGPILWSAFAVLSSLALTGALAFGAGRRLLGLLAGAVALWFVAVALPGIASEAGFLQTVGTAALLGSWWAAAPEPPRPAS